MNMIPTQTGADNTHRPGGKLWVCRFTDLSYSRHRDGDTVASVDFIALHIQSQSVEGNPRGRWLLIILRSDWTHFSSY